MPLPLSVRDPELLAADASRPRAQPCARCGWSVLAGEALCANCGLSAPEELCADAPLRLPGPLWERAPLASLAPVPTAASLRAAFLALHEYAAPASTAVSRALVEREPVRCLAPLAAARDARLHVLTAALTLLAQGRVERVVIVARGQGGYPWRALWRSLGGEGALTLCERSALKSLAPTPDALLALDDWDELGPLSGPLSRAPAVLAARHRVVLSAMPLLRGARELHALLEWLRPGAAGPLARWPEGAPPASAVSALSLLEAAGPALFASEPAPGVARPAPMAPTLARWVQRYWTGGEASDEASEAHALLGLPEWGPDGARWVLARVQGSGARALTPRALRERRGEFVAAAGLLRARLSAPWWPQRG